MPIKMNPYDENKMEPNFWLSCILIDEDAMCNSQRRDNEAFYTSEAGKTCPDKIFDTLEKYNVQSRPIWKPMHAQPIFKDNAFVARKEGIDVGAAIFKRGLCLPSDVKMTAEEQEVIIQIIRSCFE